MSYTFSMLSMNFNDLQRFVDFIDYYSQHSSQNQQATIKRVLDGMECIWGVNVPEHIDQYLDVAYSTIGECFSGALPQQN